MQGDNDGAYADTRRRTDGMLEYACGGWHEGSRRPSRNVPVLVAGRMRFAELPRHYGVPGENRCFLRQGECV